MNMRHSQARAALIQSDKSTQESDTSMKTEIYQWNSPQQETIVRAAVKVLDGGGVAAIPTETVYGLACRAEPEAIRRLDAIKARAEGKRYSLHIGKPEDVYRYVPQMPLRVQALVRKGLPGPITLVCQPNEPNLAELRQKLSDKVFNILYENGSIGIRCPNEQAALAILSRTVWPIVAPSANPSGMPPATSAQQVLEYFDGQIEMIVDGGPQACRYQQSSTVVKISDAGVEILREGVLTRAAVEELATAQIVFVCTGNTCRSPMAQVLAANYLSKKMSCNIDELPAFGYKIDSFGVSAYDGCRASEEACKVLRKKGLSLDRHSSRLLRRQDIQEADLIFVMSRHHRDAVLALDNQAADRVFLLDPDGEISDPIGFGETQYQACATQIEQAIEKRFKDLL